MTKTAQKITPFLWFDNDAEQAMKFYTSIFRDSKVKNVSYYGDAGPRPKGMLMSASFQLQGQDFIVLNGGPQFKFNPAISFLVSCETQHEVDEFWAKLSEGGEKGQCGWLTDKFGLSWQIIPRVLGEMLADKDAERSNRVMEVMLKMNKIDIKTLENAYNQPKSQRNTRKNLSRD